MTPIPEPTINNGPADYDPPCPADLRDASGRLFDTDPSELAIKLMTCQAQHDHLRESIGVLTREYARLAGKLNALDAQVHQDRQAALGMVQNLRHRFDEFTAAVALYSQTPTHPNLLRLQDIANNR
jgi:hypothetical protein